MESEQLGCGVVWQAVEDVNKYITLAGPETVGNMYINEV